MAFSKWRQRLKPLPKWQSDMHSLCAAKTQSSLVTSNEYSPSPPSSGCALVHLKHSTKTGRAFHGFALPPHNATLGLFNARNAIDQPCFPPAIYLIAYILKARIVGFKIPQKYLNFPQIFRNFFCWERAKLVILIWLDWLGLVILHTAPKGSILVKIYQ